jgi:hypothetical protein
VEEGEGDDGKVGEKQEDPPLWGTNCLGESKRASKRM